MERIKVLNEQIGKELKDAKVESFRLDGKLVCEVMATYFKFDNWIRVVSTDERTIAETETQDLPANEPLHSEGHQLDYPISPIGEQYPEFSSYLNKKLIGVSELVSRKATTMSFGLKLSFEGDLTFILENQDYPIDKQRYIFEDAVPNNLIEGNTVSNIS